MIRRNITIHFFSRSEGLFTDTLDPKVDFYRVPWARHNRYLETPIPEIHLYVELDFPNPYVKVSQKKERERVMSIQREREREIHVYVRGANIARQ